MIETDAEPAALGEQPRRGHVVHAERRARGVVAHRHGVPFVAGTEHVVGDQ